MPACLWHDAPGGRAASKHSPRIGLHIMHERAFWEAAASALGGRVALGELASSGAFARWAADEGLASLLLRAASGSAEQNVLRANLHPAALHQIAVGVVQQEELRRVLRGFAAAGLSPLLLKGAALAYTVYLDPTLRPRVDTDLFIRDDESARVCLALEGLGYRRPPEISGRLVTSQFHYERWDAHGVRHACDVHVRISNTLAFAERFSYDELRSSAVALPRLHPGALGPSPVHSLLIACMHRVAHHREADDLLWLFDIFLLAGSLTESEWEHEVALAAAKQLSGVVLRGLERTRSAFGASAPDDVCTQLGDAARHEPALPSFAPDTRTIDVAMADFAALTGWRARAQLVREHLFPPRSYMRSVYARCPPPLLPLAYAYRAVRGVPKWLSRPR
jgi:hypothetical protein